MTSDAKIGLLLGLVFIFVIAFIINGLPNFSNPSQAEATPMLAFPDENLGLADSAHNAQEQLDWEALLEQESDVLVDLEPVAVDSEAARVPSETMVAVDGEDVRSVYTFDSLMGGVTRTIEDVVNRFAESSRPTALQVEASEPAPAMELREPEAKLREMPSARRSTPTERPSTKPTPRIYVVQDGDVLATVAKKAYGAEEGNRLVNINRIFEANRMTLESPDQIIVGQKLSIPPLPKSQAAGKPGPTLSEALFEKVQDIGRRNLGEIGPDRPQGSFYVVQDGDSLWKIAQVQLGNGTRHEEIVKLNADLLKNKDTLAIGMKLRLPAK